MYYLYPSEDESDGVEDDEEEEAEEDRWPTLGQALRHSIASHSTSNRAERTMRTIAPRRVRSLVEAP
jgi:uncharacterized DUF497 family protein